MTHSNGFTLTELMISVAVSAILLNVAVPSFQSTIEGNRVSQATNEMFSTLLSARAEALRQGKNLIICQSDDDETCMDYSSAITPWEGWVVQALDNRSKTALNFTASSDQLIHVQNTGGFEGVTVSFSAGRSLMLDSRSQIRTESEDSVLALPSTEPYFLICGNSSEDGQAKAIVINAIGQPFVIDEAVAGISLECV